MAMGGLLQTSTAGGGHAYGCHSTCYSGTGRPPWLRWALLALGIVGLVVVYPYLTTGCAIVYNYAWWLTRSSTVTYVSPVAADWPAPAPSVPRILHQTWKDHEVPAKWRAAQQSCIDHHPDYE